MKDELVRTQYVIMKILKDRRATNHMKSITLNEIAEKEGRSKTNTLYKHIRVLVCKGLVGQGAKAERANAYYLSEKGLELLKNFDDMEDETDGKEY